MGAMVIFAHPHEDPGSTDLRILNPMNALARDPDEESIEIMEPQGGKGMNQFSARRSKRV